MLDELGLCGAEKGEVAHEPIAFDDEAVDVAEDAVHLGAVAHRHLDPLHGLRYGERLFEGGLVDEQVVALGLAYS